MIRIRHISVIFAILLFLFSCSENTTPPDNKKNNLSDCPPRYSDGDGYRYPKIKYYDQRVSYDLTKLITYVGSKGICLIDLNTLELKILNNIIKNAILEYEDTVKYQIEFGPLNPVWCPYSNDKIMVLCQTMIDTIGDCKKYVGGTNFYIVSLDGKECKKVTPVQFGKAGARIGIMTPQWLFGSGFSLDSLYFYILGTYIIQQKVLVSNNKFMVRQSLSGKHWFGYDSESSVTAHKVIDGRIFYFPEEYLLLENTSISPDEKYIAFSVKLSDNKIPDSLRRYEEIWIIDLEKYLREKPDTVQIMNIINLRREFCMYNSTGLEAEFITNHTLAVGMHKDEPGAVQNLWEISIDGKIIRQLTKD
ncbi:MAG: hypothetical protein QG635_366 [Bacteroidota bacterium]|nr:hypothetical protein [Bacteroidota bacterium]